MILFLDCMLILAVNLVMRMANIHKIYVRFICVYCLKF